MRKTVLLIALMLVIFSFSACYKDRSPLAPYQPGTCEPGNVPYEVLADTTGMYMIGMNGNHITTVIPDGNYVINSQAEYLSTAGNAFAAQYPVDFNSKTLILMAKTFSNGCGSISISAITTDCISLKVAQPPPPRYNQEIACTAVITNRIFGVTVPKTVLPVIF